MPFDPALRHRHSIRQGGHDYAGPGVYFVTLCTADRHPLFGTVVNGRMALKDAGRAAAACWRDIPDHFPMERAVFDASLGNGTPMIWMLPRGLPSAWPPRVQRAIEAGRLLIFTPFDRAVTGVSGPRAVC